jgi:hypothetical protein
MIQTCKLRGEGTRKGLNAGEDSSGAASSVPEGASSIDRSLKLYTKFVLDAAATGPHAARVMVRHRASFDPLMPVNEPRWVVVRRMDQALVESTCLAPRADLKAAFVHALAAYADAGWTLERFSSDVACAFCHRTDERRIISVECFDPRKPRAW